MTSAGEGFPGSCPHYALEHFIQPMNFQSATLTVAILLNAQMRR